MKEPKYVLEVPIFNPDLSIQTIENNDRLKMIEKAQNSVCDILGLRFNCESIDNISPAKEILKNLLPKITKPLMINGSGKDDIDRILLPELIKLLKRPCIISNANENTYKDIVPCIGKHSLVLKTPIDINLCKELNILSCELGLSFDKIIIDTDIGGLGYGLDYGYSTIEKIKLADDEYLKAPIISFVAYETLKTKEAKTNMQGWGSLKDRIKMLEIASITAVKAAGADIIVAYHSDSIKVMKGLE